MSIIRQGFESADLDVPVVLPTLNLDFANSQSLDSRITFSRGSIGTRVNRNGLIETIPANQPRFDFDPISGECRGLLIEESRSNIVLQSESINTSPWSPSAASISSNVITAPDGNTTADKLVENTSFSNFKFVSQSVGTISGTYTVSAFFKAGERFSGYLQLLSSGGNGAAFFNLRTGTITGGAGTNTIIPYGNGWYRITSTQTFTSASAQIYIVLNNSNGTSNYTGDGTSGIYIWGAQVEAGAFPTSYIPTTASTVTRSADNAQMTGTNFSSWYNSSEGTVYSSINFIENLSSSNFASNNILYGINDNSTNNRITLFGLNGNKSIVSRYVISGFTYPSSTVVISSRQNKFAHSFKTTGISLVGNGGTPSTSQTVTSTYPIVNRLEIGNQIGTFYLNGTISRLTYYPKALSPAELQYLTQ